MHDLPFFQQLIEGEINKLSFNQKPAELYDPIRYMLKMGGKRLRPALVMMSCEMFGGDFSKALPQALGVEVFHNFTLLHDDIMDKAPLRRSQKTVHAKWNADVAILSGDAMFVKACQLMMKAEEKILHELMEHFLESALLVCEGQQWDMTFQTYYNVTIADYLKMIELKTAAMIGCAMKTGAIIAEASKEDVGMVYEFGKNLGIAFQLQDDILDVYGDEEKFGKQSGGDIIANKKTFLLLKAQELASEKELNELKHWLTFNDFDAKEKISAVKTIFESLGIKSLAGAEMNRFFNSALLCLDQVNVAPESKSILKKIAHRLMSRDH